MQVFDTDTFPRGERADDLAGLINTLELRELSLVGFSTGRGDVARYVGRHGTGRVASVALVSAVPPFMLQTDDNPDGVPVAVFDGIRAGSLVDRSQTYRDLADGPFIGSNRPGPSPSLGMRTRFGSKESRSDTETPVSASRPSPPPTSAPTSTHGITDTHKEQLSHDLLDFLTS